MLPAWGFRTAPAHPTRHKNEWLLAGAGKKKDSSNGAPGRARAIARLALLGVRLFVIFCAKNVVLDVLSVNDFIITKPIKTKQNVKHIIRKPE